MNASKKETVNATVELLVEACRYIKKIKKKIDASFHLENFPRRLIYFTPQEYGKQWNIRTRMTTTVLSAGIFLCDW